MGHKSQEGLRTGSGWGPLSARGWATPQERLPKLSLTTLPEGLLSLDASVLIFSNHRPSLQVPAGQRKDPTPVGSAERRGWRPLKAVRAGAGTRKFHYLQCRVPEGKGLTPPSCCPVTPPPTLSFLWTVCTCVCKHRGQVHLFIILARGKQKSVVRMWAWPYIR